MRYTVLVIDDLLTDYQVSKGIIEKKPDFEVLPQATNGKIGLDMIEKYKPDVITLDLNMPIMDGIETCIFLSKSEVISKIIIMSSDISPDVKHFLTDLGIKYFISKPVSTSYLVLYDALHSITNQ